MSGAKRIVIDQAEWDRLRHSAEQLRMVRHNLPALIEDVRQQTVREAGRAVGAVERRQRVFETALGTMSTRVRQVEQQAAQRLDQHAQELRQLLDETAGDLRADAAARIHQARRELGDMVDQERVAREAAVAEVAAEVAGLVAGRKGAVEAARQWLADATAMHGYLRDHLPHEQFAPGELVALSERLRLARQNLADGLAEAAVAAGQECYRDLSQLRALVEVRDREWRLLRGAALESLHVLTALVDDNRVRAGVDDAGRHVDVELDVDYWTAGKLTALRREITEATSRVSRDLSEAGEPGSAGSLPPTTDELRQIVSHSVDQWEEQLSDVVQEAGACQLASQLRVNIADLVMVALVENGYQLADGCYEGEDPRAGFVAKATHPDGGEVMVAVAPVPGVPPGSQLWIESHDAAPGAEESGRARASQLATRLRVSGLRVSDPEETSRPGLGTEVDLAAVRRQEPGSVLRLPPGGRGGRW